VGPVSECLAQVNQTARMASLQSSWYRRFFGRARPLQADSMDNIAAAVGQEAFGSGPVRRPLYAHSSEGPEFVGASASEAQAGQEDSAPQQKSRAADEQGKDVGSGHCSRTPSRRGSVDEEGQCFRSRSEALELEWRSVFQDHDSTSDSSPRGEACHVDCWRVMARGGKQPGHSFDTRSICELRVRMHVMRLIHQA